MSNKQEKICRLCLNVVDDDCATIEETTRESFGLLSLKINLSVSQNPIMCKNCTKTIRKSLDFKYACIASEDRIVSSVVANEGSKISIENYSVCRFCVQRIETDLCMPLSMLKKNRILTEDNLGWYIPEMNLTSFEETVICVNCINSLENYLRFMMRCLDVEEKIDEYCKDEGTDDNGQVKLSSVLQFIYRKSLQHDFEYHHVDVIKTEPILFVEGEYGKGGDKNEVLATVKQELDLKHEQTEIKVERTDTSRFQPRGTLQPEIKPELIHNRISKATPYKCKLCTFESEYKSSLRTHTLTHKNFTEITLHKCCTCSYEAKYKSSLKRHMLVHERTLELANGKSSSAYSCPLCEFKTNRKQSCKRHMIIHKDRSEVTMYKCPACTYETKHKSDLKRHVRTHERLPLKKRRKLTHKDPLEITRFKCHTCTYETTQKSYLRKHMLIHKNPFEINMFKCKVCSYKATRKFCLRQHMFTHRNLPEVMMYKCDMCAYQTSRKSHLILHTLTHKDPAEIVMYKCEECKYETKRKDHLIRHKLTHRDPSQVVFYQCDVCVYRTKSSRSFKHHMLKHNSPQK